MGFLDFFKKSDQPTTSQINKAVKQVTEPHGDASIRLGAGDRLKAWGTPEAVSGLLRRFTIQTPSAQKDLEECQEVEAMLVELGEAAVKPIVGFLERESAVAYPARALEKILEPKEYVGHILDVLDRLEAGFSSRSEQRADLIRALDDAEDDRIAGILRRFLSDPSDDVAIAALNGIVKDDDPADRDALVETLETTADRPRVQLEVAECLARLGWPMQESRKRVEAALPEGFALDKKGRIVVI